MHSMVVLPPHLFCLFFSFLAYLAVLSFGSATKARTRISQLQRSFLQLVDEFPAFFAATAAAAHDGAANAAGTASATAATTTTTMMTTTTTAVQPLPAPVWSHLVALVERAVRCGFVAYEEANAEQKAVAIDDVISGSDGDEVVVFLPHFAERALAVLPRLFGVNAVVAAATFGTEQSSAAAASAAAADAPPPVSVLASLPPALVARTAETCIGTIARLLRCCAFQMKKFLSHWL